MLIRIKKCYKIIVIGVSSGGMDAMKKFFPALPKDFPIPIVVVQHISAHSDSEWISILNRSFPLEFKEVDEKEVMQKGFIYIAPPNYHLLVESDGSFTLNVDEKVNYARPSIDVLFETAAHAFRDQVVGIILTGSNHDGAAGLKRIKEYGGLCVVQEPKTAVSSYMPQAAIDAVKPDYVLDLEKIPELLKNLNR